MFSRWLKRKLPTRESIENSSFLGKFTNYLDQSNLWQFNINSVSRAVAVGLFVATVPIIPFQMILVVLLCILIRANLIIALLVSWVSNPFTIVPLAYLAYTIGNFVLGITGSPPYIIHGLVTNVWNSHHLWHSFVLWFHQVGKSFFIGLPILALSAALAGYVTVFIIWRIKTTFFKK